MLKRRAMVAAVFLVCGGACELVDAGVGLSAETASGSAAVAAPGEGVQQDESGGGGEKRVLEATTRVVVDAPAATSSRLYVPKPGEPKDVGELLDALEKAGGAIGSLKAEVRYTKIFGEIEGGEKQVRRGMLYFKAKREPAGSAPPAAGTEPVARRVFQVDFTSLEIDDVRRDEQQTFIFDGEWLIEKQASARPPQMLRRRVVAPGETIDPLAIGEGPFPVPIGQKKQRILDRFKAEMVEPSDAWPGSRSAAADQPTPPEWLAETYQLKLTPLKGTDESRRYAVVRIWYRKKDLLPRMAWTDDKNDASTEVFLLNAQTNVELGEEIFDTRLPEGWNEQVEEFRSRKADD